MKLFNFIKITLLTMCVYYAQAASSDAPAAAVPNVKQQITDWATIFGAHRGQDLMAVPMPELTDKVDQMIAYATPAIQDPVAQEIFQRYISEVRTAYGTGTLTFPLYARFILGTAALMSPTEWNDNGQDPHKAFFLRVLKNPLGSEEWLRDMPPQHITAYDYTLEMLKFGVVPYFVLSRRGHFGYERIVQGYMTPGTSHHLIGVPSENAMAHGSARSVLNFMAHDAGHGSALSNTFEATWPLVQTLLAPVFRQFPAEDSVLRRRDVAALYFLCHETGALEKNLHAAVQKNLGGSAKDLGGAILDVAKQYFVDQFIEDLLNKWSGIFKGSHSFFLSADEIMEVTKDSVKFKGRLSHGDTCTNYPSVVHIPCATLETGIFSLSLPSSPLDGIYTMAVEPEVSYMDRLRGKHAPEVFAHYERAHENFYEGAIPLEGPSKRYQITFTPQNPDDQGTPGFVSGSEFLKGTFDGNLVDEFSTQNWVRTGAYAGPQATSYTWDAVLAVREFFGELFDGAKRDWGKIWKTLELDPALIASTRSALEGYFTQQATGSDVGGAASGSASGGAASSAT